MKNIVLVGFMGTGKTAVAKALASELKMKYVSVDALIEEREGRSINDIFTGDGEKHFRRVEKEIVKEVSSGTNQVLDPGGGVVLDADNMENLRRSGTIICLWATPEAIHQRTKDHSHRPLLNVEDPQQRIDEMLEARKPFYKKADIHIDTTDLNVAVVVEQIKKRTEND
jgi:shikimate kinase